MKNPLTKATIVLAAMTITALGFTLLSAAARSADVVAIPCGGEAAAEGDGKAAGCASRSKRSKSEPKVAAPVPSNPRVTEPEDPYRETGLAYAPRDDASGYLSLTLANGQHFVGEYLAPRFYSRLTAADRFWNTWCADGGMPRGTCNTYVHLPGVAGDQRAILANLRDAAGVPAQCRIELTHRDAGISGGGVGICLLPDGRAFDTSIPELPV